MTANDSTPAFSQPKIVEKAFSLPIVLDTYSYGKMDSSDFLFLFLYFISKIYSS